MQAALRLPGSGQNVILGPPVVPGWRQGGARVLPGWRKGGARMVSQAGARVAPGSARVLPAAQAASGRALLASVQVGAEEGQDAAPLGAHPAGTAPPAPGSRPGMGTCCRGRPSNSSSQTATHSQNKHPRAEHTSQPRCGPSGIRGQSTGHGQPWFRRNPKPYSLYPEH